MVPKADVRHGLGSIAQVFGADCLLSRIDLFGDPVDPVRPPGECDVVRDIGLFLRNLCRFHLKLLHQDRQDPTSEHQDRHEKRSPWNQQREVAPENGRDEQDCAKPQSQRKRLGGGEASVDIGIRRTNHPFIAVDQDVIGAKPHRHACKGNQPCRRAEQVRPHQACSGVQIEADTLECRVNCEQRQRVHARRTRSTDHQPEEKP